MSSSAKGEIDYGPIVLLLGKWEGDQGLDIAPDPDGEEKNPYYECIDFVGAGNARNAEEQILSVVRYHQSVTRKTDKRVIHDQVGYWLWETGTDNIIQSVSIPRGVTLLAGGKASTGNTGETILEVVSEIDHPHWGIQQSPFMSKKTKTTKFSNRLCLHNETLQYEQETVVSIYGNNAFSHTDRNELRRVARAD